MAALQGFLTAPAVPLTATVAKTVLQITAPANQRLKLLGIIVSFDGTSTTAQPAACRLLRQTSAGTLTSVTAVLQEKSLSETLQATGGKNASSEPSAGDVLKTFYVHPQAGYEWPAPYGQEMIVQGGGRIGLEVTAPATVNCSATFLYEE